MTSDTKTKLEIARDLFAAAAPKAHSGWASEPAVELWQKLVAAVDKAAKELEPEGSKPTRSVTDMLNR